MLFLLELLNVQPRDRLRCWSRSASAVRNQLLFGSLLHHVQLQSLGLHYVSGSGMPGRDLGEIGAAAK